MRKVAVIYGCITIVVLLAVAAVLTDWYGFKSQAVVWWEKVAK